MDGTSEVDNPTEGSIMQGSNGNCGGGSFHRAGLGAVVPEIKGSDPARRLRPIVDGAL